MQFVIITSYVDRYLYSRRQDSEGGDNEACDVDDKEDEVPGEDVDLAGDYNAPQKHVQAAECEEGARRQRVPPERARHEEGSCEAQVGRPEEKVLGVLPALAHGSAVVGWPVSTSTQRAGIHSTRFYSRVSTLFYIVTVFQDSFIAVPIRVHFRIASPACSIIER